MHRTTSESKDKSKSLKKEENLWIKKFVLQLYKYLYKVFFAKIHSGVHKFWEKGNKQWMFYKNKIKNNNKKKEEEEENQYLRTFYFNYAAI